MKERREMSGFTGIRRIGRPERSWIVAEDLDSPGRPKQAKQSAGKDPKKAQAHPPHEARSMCIASLLWRVCREVRLAHRNRRLDYFSGSRMDVRAGIRAGWPDSQHRMHRG